MKFTFEELEQILDLSDEQKRRGVKGLFEEGKFDNLKFPSRDACIIALQLNDALFEDDPFYQCSSADDSSYFDYFLVVNQLMKDDRYKDVEQTYRCLEDMHQYIGLSSRSKIYDAMVAVQRVLKLPPREVRIIELD